MSWKATGKPLEVDEKQPIEPNDGVTDDELDEAQQNYDRMDTETRAYVDQVSQEAERIVASLGTESR